MSVEEFWEKYGNIIQAWYEHSEEIWPDMKTRIAAFELRHLARLVDCELYKCSVEEAENIILKRYDS